jgi:hypothetical protein
LIVLAIERAVYVAVPEVGANDPPPKAYETTLPEVGDDGLAEKEKGETAGVCVINDILVPFTLDIEAEFPDEPDVNVNPDAPVENFVNPAVTFVMFPDLSTLKALVPPT